MKKISLVLALLMLTLTAGAQKISGEQRDKVISDMIFNMVGVGGKFAITRTPVSYYEYWVITGRKAHSANTSISNPAYVSVADQQKVADTLNKECGGVLNFRIANTHEIHEGKKVGVQGDIRHHGGTTLGFYLVLPFKQWVPFRDAGGAVG